MDGISFYAGAARRDITPAAGICMDGYAAREGPALGLLDPLYVKAVYFAQDGGDGGDSHLFLSLDLCGASTELEADLAAGVCARLGLPRYALTLTFTHTHAGPACGLIKDMPVDRAYWESVIDTARGCAGEAKRNAAPSFLRATAAKAGFGVNRRELKDGKIVLGTNKTGELDDTVRVLAVYRRGENSCPSALIVMASCHPTSLGSENRYISADYPGTLYQRIGEIYPGAVTLFINSGAGEVNPRRVPGEDGPARARNVGNELADVVLASVAAGSPDSDCNAGIGSGSGHVERIEHVEHVERIGHVALIEQIERVEQVARIERIERDERGQHLCGVPPAARMKRLRRYLNVTFAPLPPLPALTEELYERRSALEKAKYDGSPPYAQFIENRYINWAREAISRKEQGCEIRERAVPVQLTELYGGMLFVQLPFEVFSFTVKKIVALAESLGYDPGRVFVCGYANGIYGYLTPEFVLREGGYEAEDSYKWYGLPAPYANHCEADIVNGITDMIKELQQ